MATYTYTQLAGTGSVGENISGKKVFFFTNPSASSYFTIETNPNYSGFYNSSSITNFIGQYQATESMGLITSSYISSVVVQPGSSSFAFQPTLNTVSGSNYHLRGTGMYSLNIFNPAALFTSGEKGAWFDASDLTTLFQDTAGTIPVTAVGQKVAKWLDKSGNNNHATQSNTNLQPTYRLDLQGWPCLDFDGVNDQLVTPPINFTGTAQIMASMGLHVISQSVGVLGVPLELSADVNSNNGSFSFGAPTLTADHSINLRGTTTIGARVSNVSNEDDLITGLFDISQATKELQLIPRLNFVQLTGSQITWVGGANAGTGNFGNWPLYIGSRGLTQTNPFGGHIYQIVVRGALSTSTQVYQTETYVDYSMD